MDNKEILAELKMCYEHLVDITERADSDQVSCEQEENIGTAIDYIANIYAEVFANKYTENINIKGKDNLTISDNIYSDYKDPDTGCYFTYMDFGEELEYYKWWEDYEFLIK